MAKSYINIIKASAGSGKTYNLARTYISHLLGTPTGNKVILNNEEVDQFRLRPSVNYHKHILAITFTNKATNEMKERIIKHLYLLGQGKGDFVDDFKVMFIYNDFDDVLEAARKALSNILFDYDDFNVSTIDSFFQGILRNFARELNRDYNYSIEIDQDYATEVAIHDFLMDLGHERKGQAAIDNWVRELIRENIRQQKGWDFFGHTEGLKDFAMTLYHEFYREHHDEIMEYLSDIGNSNGPSRINRFRQACIKEREKNKTEIKRQLDQLVKFFDDNGLATAIKGRSVCEKIYSRNYDSISDQNFETLQSYAEMQNALTEKALTMSRIKKAKLEVTSDMESQFTHLCQNISRCSNMAALFTSVLRNIWHLGLLGKIDEKLEQFRKDSNCILIADTNELINKVLKNGAEFIYEHAGNTLNNYMIDEFQDTSRQQYSNFKPLLQESISKAYPNLIIGDEKQSIYRFRNSDPNLLRYEVQRDFSSTPATLKKNFRSFPAIVNFNNAFFSTVINKYQDINKADSSKYKLLVDTYANIQQEIKKDSQKGLVRINVVNPESDSESSTKEKIVKALPAYILNLRNQGYNLRDIAILVNTHDEGRAIIEQVLIHNDAVGNTDDLRYIDIISDEELLLNNSPSVRLIISVLQFLETTQYSLPEDEREENTSPEDDIFKKFLKKRVAEQKQYKILHDFQSKIQFLDNKDNEAGKALLDCFENEYQEQRDKSVEKRLNSYSHVVDDVMPNHKHQLTNIITIVEKIIEHYVIPNNSALVDDEVEQEIENSFLMGFMDVVIQFNHQRNGGTVREFLKFWETKQDKLTINSPSDANAVSLMTIHKSKGLEFKCIIIPFANWKLVKIGDRFWINGQDWINKNIADIDQDLIPALIPVGTSQLQQSGLFDQQINDEREQSLIDNLNKLYVALTRPKEELHIFVINKETQKNANEIAAKGIEAIEKASSLICRYVPDMEGLPAGFETQISEKELSCDSFSANVNDENEEKVDAETLHVTVYEIGEPVIAGTKAQMEPDNDSHSNQEEKSLHVTQPMPDYRSNPQVLPVRVSMHKTSGSIKRQGIRMHEVFSQIDSINDFNRALNYGINNELFRNNTFWTEARFKKLLDTIKSDSELSSWFDTENTVYNERNISIPKQGDDNKQFEHLRPDRIIIRPNGEMLVIDYKFGFKHDAATIKDDSDSVVKYMERLRPLLKATNIKGFLWYARYNEIVPVGN